MVKPTKRKAFNFLRSYFDVLNELNNDSDKLNFLLAIINKQFLDQDPNKLNFIAKLCYESQRHSIESSVKGWKRVNNTDMQGNPTTNPSTIMGTNPKEEKGQVKEKEKLFKPDFELFIDSCFKYLGMPYTKGNPSTHGIESPIRKWLLNQDSISQRKNLNAYIKVTPDKKFRAKTIEKLLEKLEGYNFCQDVNNYVAPVINGQLKKTKEQIEQEEHELLEIKKGYERMKKTS